MTQSILITNNQNSKSNYSKSNIVYIKKCYEIMKFHNVMKFWPLSSCYFPYSFAKYFVNICENKDDISAIIMRQWLLVDIIIWSLHVTPALKQRHVVFTTLK